MTPARYSHGTLRKPYGSDWSISAMRRIGPRPSLDRGRTWRCWMRWRWRWRCVSEGADPGPLYARLRRWHVRLYQVMSAVFTPQYQSDSRMLPVLRDRLLMPLSQTWPVPRVLTRLVGGRSDPAAGGGGFSAANGPSCGP